MKIWSVMGICNYDHNGRTYAMDNVIAMDTWSVKSLLTLL